MNPEAQILGEALGVALGSNFRLKSVELPLHQMGVTLLWLCQWLLAKLN
jgi:hypothetical protein